MQRDLRSNSLQSRWILHTIASAPHRFAPPPPKLDKGTYWTRGGGGDYSRHISRVHSVSAKAEGFGTFWEVLQVSV